MHPLNRGFDYFYGFLCNGDIDYMAKTAGNFFDFWDQLNFELDEQAMSTDVRSSDMYMAKVDDFLIHHEATYGHSKPFFLYYPLQDPHTPLDAPDYFLNSAPCVNIADETRQVYCGMIRCIDTAVEGLMATASSLGLTENIVVIFSGDNGGAPKKGGYNYPMRGSKGTLYEGGVRQQSWVWSPLLPQGVRGTVNENPFSLIDMLPTFVSIASGGVGKPTKQTDGVDIWGAIMSGTGVDREWLLYNVVDESGGIRYGCYAMLWNCKEDG